MSVRVMADKVMPNHWLEDEGTPRLWRYSHRLGKTTAYSTPEMNMNRWMMDRLVRLKKASRNCEDQIGALPGFDQPKPGLTKALSPGRIWS